MFLPFVVGKGCWSDNSTSMNRGILEKGSDDVVSAVFVQRDRYVYSATNS